jgi:hypothetical protein
MFMLLPGYRYRRSLVSVQGHSSALMARRSSMARYVRPLLIAHITSGVQDRSQHQQILLIDKWSATQGKAGRP